MSQRQTKSEALYDLDLNADRDRILVYRRGRVRHQWTRAEAIYLKEALGLLIPKLKT